MKFKRIIAGTVSAGMLTAALTGCSQAEQNMISIHKTVASWDTYTCAGTVDINIDKDGIVKTAAMLESEITAEDLAELPDKASIDYNMSANIAESEYDLDITLKLDDNSYPFEIMVDGSKIAISDTTVDSVAALIQDYDILETDKTKIEYLKDTATDGYIIFDDEEDDDIISKPNVNASSDIIDGLQSIFSKYSSSLITSKSKNEVEINIGIEAIENDLTSILSYISDNRDEIVKVMDDIANEMIGYNGDDISDEDEISFDDIIPSKEEMQDVIAETKEYIASSDYKPVRDMFKDSYIKETMNLKSDTEYEETAELAVKTADAELLAVKAAVNIVKQDVAPLEIKGTVATEDGYKQWYFKKYPVSKVAVDWLADDYNNVTLTSYGENATAYVDYIPMTMIDERIYVPMRAISEALGYEVVWDAENYKAYAVTEAGEYVDMTGIIIDETTFIKVRDFEKLGLTVDYEEDDLFRTATVSK